MGLWGNFSRFAGFLAGVGAVFFFAGVGSALAAGAEWMATDSYRVLNFAVLSALLFFLLRKPAGQVFRGRIQGIRDQLSSLEARKVAAEAELARYNEKIARLEQESSRIIDDYVRQGNEARANILREAEAAAQKMEAQARRSIEYEFKKARIELQQEIFDKAMVRAEEIIKHNITSNDQDRLVDEYLKKVVAQ